MSVTVSVDRKLLHDEYPIACMGMGSCRVENLCVDPC